MPKRLLIIGVLFCLWGGIGVVRMLTSVLRGRVLLDLTVCMLAVGIGLLHGRRTSRRWATFWLGLALALVLGVVLLGILYGPPGPYEIGVIGVRLTGGPAFAVPLALAALIALAIWLLYSKPVSQFIDRLPEQAPQPDAPKPGAQ